MSEDGVIRREEWHGDLRGTYAVGHSSAAHHGPFHIGAEEDAD
jgi:hypothetical protein